MKAFWHSARNWLSKNDGIPEDQWCYGPNWNGDYTEGMKLMSNAENKKGYRLPANAEWEFSCRAGAGTLYSYGETSGLLGKYGWFNNNSPNETKPVGSLKPNDLGLFDLHGNILEWCQEGLGEQEANTHKLNTSIIVIGTRIRLLRGGGFQSRWQAVRSSTYIWNKPGAIGPYGFRPARTYP